MGISGLLPVLGNIMESKHVSVYKGMKVAVDTVSGYLDIWCHEFVLSFYVSCIFQYGWLHRGAYSCSLELCTGAPTDK
jgi:exonuclease-1